MRKNELLKNPIVRAKVGKDVYNPAGSILEEISEQDMSESGGIWTYDYFTCGCGNASKALGNKGGICTITKECQAICN
ncbi:MAG: plantaricin C family lantibiotic [Clostridium tyrobutyricum]|jgi:hypothetical protein|uniref:plantaricin C family lantibiotic n=1 Tax=Clostridium tyrobutyricum TaxID=1519 RepID=UPI0024309747|nr:plantaricin C family lantibiotic [Clostridium tyrobutyricum]MCH4259531.1 plantaricin C family lantibiotic [Clostridium tyrobutyricum]